MIFRRIRTRVIVAVLPLVVVAAILHAAASYRMLAERLKQESELKIETLLNSGTALISAELDKNARLSEALVYGQNPGQNSGLAGLAAANLQNLVSSLGAGGAGRVFLLNEQGDCLASSESPALPPAEAGKLVMLDRPGAVVDYKGKSYRARVGSVPGTGWRLAILLDEGEIVAPARVLLYRMLPVSLVCLLVITLAVLMLARYFNSMLRRVNAFSQRVAEGRLEERLSPGARDEFACIADNLNTVLENVQNLIGAQSSFLSRMSHEIRTPMNAISNKNDILLLAQEAVRKDKISAFEAEWVISAGIREGLKIKSDSLIGFSDAVYERTKKDLAVGHFFIELTKSLEKDHALTQELVQKRIPFHTAL